VVVDNRNSAVRVSVDSASGAGLTFQRKAVSPQGADQFSNRGVAEAMDEVPWAVHTVTVTAGVSMILTPLPVGTLPPFSNRTSMYA